MNFLEELFLTAIISILLAFLLGKIAADRPEVATEDLGSRPRVGLSPIQEEAEEEEHPAGKSSGNALGHSDCAETKVVERLDENEAVVGFDRGEENFLDEVVEIGRIDDDLREQDVGKAEDEVSELSSEVLIEKGKEAEVDEEKGGSLLHGEDEWEGIERSEVEKLFAVAIKFVGSKKGGDAMLKLSNEVQMQLYGLHKVATEGPCHEPQPMALKVSARSKWHAWQRLGNMNPEAAMEQYINLLTERIPEWMTEKDRVESKGHDGNDLSVDVYKMGQLDSKSSHSSETEISVENSSSIEGVTDNVDTGPKLFKQGLTKIFLFNMISPTRATF
ncbi:acyl-CoA-binding domain-containing protein 3-like isoform X3 [Canna indica]|uniref:Acyl-CoA-binding domain-containing protein 3-like isoform X3 n=1 Tax=Canna indica TaxID=4628 RepID=A0AAQ3Q590_9LILI|nr:acyl-CoA-binding domain-containing protein 3-like isoform X3 [Canna indica]